MEHLIHKIEFNFSIPGKEQALDFRKDFMQKHYQQFAAIIEAECDQIAGDNQYIQIERIAINLPIGKDIFTDPSLCLNFFRKKLRESLKSSTKSSSSTRSATETQIAILFFFLNHGRFPWGATGDNKNLSHLCDSIMKTDSSGMLNAGLLQKEQSPFFWQRFVDQLTPSFKNRVIQNNKPLRNLKKKLSALFVDLNQNPEKKSIGDDEKSSGAEWKNNRIRNNNLSHFPDFEKTFDDFLVAHGSRFLSASSSEMLQDLNNKTLLDLLTSTKSAFSEPEKASEVSPEAVPEKEQHKKWVIQNAGIILLHTFLPELFKNLGYWKNNEWIDNTAVFRAMHLLHYMATGLEDPFEYQLLLEKIICGVPASHPVPKKIDLSPEEKNEAEVLLQTVIDHWVSLKNTSVQGLQSHFLQREGLLMKTASAWELRIEQKTADVLLESLPWGFRTILLPWNSYIIHTEW